MYELLHGIFADKEGGRVFTCFGPWHISYVLLTIAAIAALIFVYRNKDQHAKDKLLKVLVAIPFTLYMMDFFLMPLAYGEISVDKLPFHACTLMSIMCFVSRQNTFLHKYRLHFVMLGLLANLIYLVYPSGVMAYELKPHSYRVVQTMLFHASMIVCAVVSLWYDSERPTIKRCYRDVAVLGLLTVWAMLGNAVYSGAVGDYDHDFNWFFLKADPLAIFPESIAPYIMPWLNIVIFFAAEALIYLLLALLNKLRRPTAVEEA